MIHTSQCSSSRVSLLDRHNSIPTRVALPAIGIGIQLLDYNRLFLLQRQATKSSSQDLLTSLSEFKPNGITIQWKSAKTDVSI